MNEKMLEQMKSGKGFIAALDQSGGSTPKALKNYGINEDQYSSEEEMFDLIHKMRSRIITSKVFTNERILGAILFRKTMNSKIEGKYAAEYLWEEKGIVPFLKVDEGMEAEKNGCQLMKPIKSLDEQIKEANEHKVFGTKMRSVIGAANREGIAEIIRQQFEVGKKIFDGGLVPILEPEVTITIPDKAEAEEMMLEEIKKNLEALPENYRIMFKFSLPTKEGFYDELAKHPQVVRVVALSGGYPIDEANELLAKNSGMIASFSRALLNDLSAQQSDDEFDAKLDEAIENIYQASIQ